MQRFWIRQENAVELHFELEIDKVFNCAQWSERIIRKPNFWVKLQFNEKRFLIKRKKARNNFFYPITSFEIVHNFWWLPIRTYWDDGYAMWIHNDNLCWTIIPMNTTIGKYVFVQPFTVIFNRVNSLFCLLNALVTFYIIPNYS